MNIQKKRLVWKTKLVFIWKLIWTEGAFIAVDDRATLFGRVDLAIVAEDIAGRAAEQALKTEGYLTAKARRDYKKDVLERFARERVAGYTYNERTGEEQEFFE